MNLWRYTAQSSNVMCDKKHKVLGYLYLPNTEQLMMPYNFARFLFKWFEISEWNIYRYPALHSLYYSADK